MSATSHSARAPRGFATIVIIALLVMLAAFGGAIAILSSTQQGGQALDLQGVRAYQAARAGTEWSLYHLLRTGGLGCAGINGTSFAFAGNLAGFRVSVQCSQSTHEEGSSNTVVYSVTATACNDAAACPTAASPPPAYYVERQLTVTAASN